MRDLNIIKIDKERLKKIIKYRNTTQVEIAEQIGMSKDYLNQRIRAGYMNEFTLDKICRHLNVSPADITGENTLTADEIREKYSNNTEIDNWLRSTFLNQVDDSGNVVFTYDQYKYSKNSHKQEDQIRSFLKSLVVTVRTLNTKENEWHVEKHALADTDYIDVIMYSIKQCIRECVDKYLLEDWLLDNPNFDFEKDYCYLDVFGNDENELSTQTNREEYSDDKEDIQKK